MKFIQFVGIVLVILAVGIGIMLASGREWRAAQFTWCCKTNGAPTAAGCETYGLPTACVPISPDGWSWGDD